MEWYWIIAIIIGAIAIWLVLSSVFYKRFFKRFYDIVLSGFALIILSPLLLIMTIVGAIAMKGNPFFVQPRPGKIDPKTGKEKIFKLIKFRTMSNEKDKDGNLLPDEKRLNNYGKFCRTTSIDELGELVNIFIGDMSIIGPRPQLVRDMVFMTEEQRQRHTVRPGLSGLAQVSGRNAISWDKKFSIDLEYIKEITFFEDIRIILLTVKKVFEHDGIAAEGQATVDDFGDVLLKEGKISQVEYCNKQDKAKQILMEAGL